MLYFILKNTKKKKINEMLYYKKKKKKKKKSELEIPFPRLHYGFYNVLLSHWLNVICNALFFAVFVFSWCY